MSTVPESETSAPVPYLALVAPERTAAATASDQEAETENKLRPTSLDGFIGQGQQIARLKVALQASIKRDGPLPHLLVSGPPGLGKTTIAQLIATERGSRLVKISAPGISSAGDLIGILTGLGEHDVLFVDEIHRLRTKLAETLYTAMEDFRVDVIFGEDSDARSSAVVLPPFTLVGATTNAGHLPKPLIDRFGLHFALEFYDQASLVSIIHGAAARLGEAIEPEAAIAIATSARGTPRIANRLLGRVLDYALVQDAEVVTEAIARETLAMEGLDGAGLDDLDRRYLKALLGPHQGGPAGLGAIAALMQEDVETLREMVEPYLLHQGFVLRTNAGRVATEYAATLYGQ